MDSHSFIELVEDNKETTLIAYLDLANMFHWQNTLGWQFSVPNVIEQLFKIEMVKEIRVYWGLNERALGKSQRFHQHLREKGAIVVTKKVKWIKKEINRSLFVSSYTQNSLDENAYSKLDEFISYLRKKNVAIEEPKCNFDVEMALDMLDAIDKVSGILIFSGDSDLHSSLERLKLKGKRIYLFGVRGHIARELLPLCVKYVDFGKWYEGNKKRKPRS